MHSAFIRANVIFAYFMSILALMAAGNYMSCMYHDPEISVTFSNPSIYQMGYYRNYFVKGDQVDFEIDIDADLRDVFNWNVKQIYVYIEAEYETAKEHYNRAVVWDKIIEDKDSAYIKVEREMIEYPLMDIHRLLRGNNIRLTLVWDFMPVVGMLHQGGGFHRQSFNFTLPDHYIYQ